MKRLSELLDRLTKLLERRGGLIAASAAVSALHLLGLILIHALPIDSDQAAYHEVGLAVAHGRPWLTGSGLAQTDWMPGYPTLIGLVYAFAGARPVAVRILQACLIGLDAGLCFVVVRRLLGARLATIGFLFIALTPVLFAYQSMLLSEILTLTLVSLFMEMLTAEIPATPSGLVGWATRFGLIGGALCFTRAELALWMVAVPILLVGRVSFARIAGLTATAALVTLLFLAPWVSRNWAYHHELIPFTTVTGRALWLSAQMPEQTDYSSPLFDAAFRACETLDHPKEVDACMSKGAVAAAEEHKAYFLSRTGARLVRTLVASHTDYLPGFQYSFGAARAQHRWFVLGYKLLSLLFHALLALAAAAGLWRQRHSRIWLLIAWALGSKLAVHAVYFGTSRYAVPLQPILVLCALGLFAAGSAQAKLQKT